MLSEWLYGNINLRQFQFTCLYDIVNMLNHKCDVLNWELFLTEMHSGKRRIGYL